MPTAHSPDLTQPIPGYEILELLGSGGMSSVYKARQKGLDRLVAIKVIRRDQIDPGLALARLLKEARVLTRLDHPAIVRSIDYGEIGDLVYFVMELVDGHSCKQLVVDRGRFPLREVILIGERVAQALGHAASHGVIHRDVKPGNILLAKDGAVKLTDFGLARATRDRSLTQDGITVGTPQYMSPEQVRSPRRVDLRSDLYSLGATLYHLATGDPPFRGDSVGEILHDVLYTSPRPPEQIVPTLPAGFSRVLARLLAKDVKRRYASSAALVADLERVRAGLADGADDDSVGLSWQESAEPPPRTLKPWLLLGAALVVAGVTAFALLHDRGARADPLADAKSREDALLGQLARALDEGRESPAAVLAKIGELQRAGSITVASALERVDLKTRAEAELSKELDAAAAAARSDARTRLARADLPGAAAAFEENFARRCASLVPPALAGALAAADADPAEGIRRRAADHAAEIDALAQRVRRKVGSALLDARYHLTSDLEAAHAEGRLADVRELLSGYPQRERAACVAAARAELVAAGIALAPDLGDAELESHLPEVVRNEILRDPAASVVQAGKDELDYVIARRQRDLLAAIRTARDADAAAIEQEEADVDPAQRHKQLEAALAAQAGSLASVGALPDELPAEWSAYDAKLAAARERRLAERWRAALARLLDGDGDHAGVITLLQARNVAAARAAVEAAQGLSPEDLAAWSGVVADVAGAFAAAHAALEKEAGGEVELRDRGGVAIRGRLASEGSKGSFAVGARTGVRVEELSCSTLEPRIGSAIEGEARRAALLFLLGDRKDHEKLDPELERLQGDRVIAALLRTRVIEKMGDAAVKDDNEKRATKAGADFDQAIAAGDAAAADAALTLLLRLPETVAGKGARRDREKLEGQIAAARRNSRTLATLNSVAPNADDRTINPDGSVAFVYRFDRSEAGGDFGLTTNAERVENGRLFFVGDGLGAREAGPVLRLPLDRRAPASLRVELFAPKDEPKPPHFVGLRLGPACVGFFRPNEPKGESFEPELAAWFGTLNEFGAHFFTPALGEAEPKLKGKWVAKGLDRATKHVVELKWLPDSGTSNGTLEVALDGLKVLTLAGAMTGSPETDCLELRSATALQVDSVAFRGRLR